MEQQAIKRAHRIGQTKEVFVEKIIIENTIEELMVNLADLMQGSLADIQEHKIKSLLKQLTLVPPKDDEVYPDSCFWTSPQRSLKYLQKGQEIQAKTLKEAAYRHIWYNAEGEKDIFLLQSKIQVLCCF